MLKLEPDNAAALALGRLMRARRITAARSPISTRRSPPTAPTRWPMASAQVYLAKNDRDRRSPTSTAPSNSARSAPLPTARARRSTKRRRRPPGDRRSRQPSSASRRPRILFRPRAALRKAKGENDQALADLDDGLRRQPDNLTGLMARAADQTAQGRCRRRRCRLRRRAENEPNNMPTCCAGAPWRWMETRSFAKATDDLRSRRSRREPKNAQAYYQRGLAREQENQRDWRLPTTNSRSPTTAPSPRRARRWPVPHRRATASRSSASPSATPDLKDQI